MIWVINGIGSKLESDFDIYANCIAFASSCFFFFFGYVQYNFAGKIGAISEWADKFRQKSRNIYFLTKELFENGNIKYKIFLWEIATQLPHIRIE